MNPEESADVLALWDALQPDEAATLLATVSARWWIAGGWALDLFRSAPTRPHGDLDIGLLRHDVATLLDALSTWEVFEATDGHLTRLGLGVPPRERVHSLWCRRSDRGPWQIELMLDDGDDDTWHYRRDRRIQRPMLEAVRQTDSGLPYLAPEIQLLYKSKAPRGRDEIDFREIEELLAPDARTWLCHALELTNPRHHWLPTLRRV